MHEILRTASESLLFEVTAAPCLVLDADLRIQGANPACLRATRRSRDELLGASMSDAFPDNPQDATATGVRNLGASLERVLRRGAPDDMGCSATTSPMPPPRAVSVPRRRVRSTPRCTTPTGASSAYCTTSRTSPPCTTF
ncbi:hypothetical protein GCM10010358_58260 [Streptomyces minutiscleroticus]|uniref:PAS domain-containing protein n=1 Tax=Streptomyces minutiscleroticus TaxID=68238 RepID=A0A918NUC0_9ACTN|nr:PAS domain-containing protein [Streptomyces minutiscleroticus]GGX96880.1 hypothetical protein GCM10010358_58260 [Streptomyces minutiscleroticus]